MRTQLGLFLQRSTLGATALLGSLSCTVVIPSPLGAHEMPAAPPSQGDPSSPEKAGHHHTTLEIGAGQPVPAVQLLVRPDSLQGWNLELKVTNFRFAPEHINTKSVTTEGHAHLYIDGKKITRLYGSWYYLSHLEPGKHTITVSLNANGHEQLTYKGQAIQDSATIQVPASRKPEG